ncbi:MAG: minor extracellular serine protease Vpr [Crocinitomicaceae bacterium]|jgi:minor extracellular serine protease Vpr
MRLIALFLALPFLGTSQTTSSNNTKADISVVFNAFEKTKGASAELRQRFPIHTIHGRDYVSFLGITANGYDKASLESRGVLIGSRIESIVSFKYPLENLDKVLLETGFERIEIAGMIKPMLSKVPGDIRADSVWGGYGLPQGYTGKDVIIGVTDWGFDYTHPMFYDTLLADTRILAAWDQFKNSGPAPSGYAYGTEYSTPTELLAAGADTANIYSYATHGSHVSGIAGGSGAGTIHRGIAFESNFLFTTFLVDEGSVLDAWQWMFDKADVEGKRLVINMSWGLYHMGAIDGTSILSQALDSYSDQNVIFVSSAGNNGSVNFHLEKDFASDTLLSRIDFYNSATLATLWGQSIHMWGEPGNEFTGGIKIYDNVNTVVAESPDYSTATTTGYIDTFLVVNATDTIWYNLSADAAYPSNGRPQIRLRVTKPPTNFKVLLKSTAVSGKLHCWNVTELTSDVGNWGMPFSGLGAGTTVGNNEYGIGTPACSNTAISVAAHNSEYYTISQMLVGGQPSSFGSIGPLMTDSLKPDISAPGVQVASSISSYTDNSFSQLTSVDFNGRTYPFARFSGTSMSSPAVVGVVALILESNPYLSPAQVKTILIQTAREDSYTGVIPPTGDTKWGWGKVNAQIAVQLALVTVGSEEISKPSTWILYPNPASTILNVSELDGEVKEIQIIDQLGRIVLAPENLEYIQISDLEAGSYILRIVRNSRVEQQGFVKQ